jgi:hypothetical protein
VIAVYAVGTLTVPHTGSSATRRPSRLADGRRAADRRWPLQHRRQAAGWARELAGAALSGWGVSDGACQNILLVVSELVTNAVEHATAPIALHLHRDSAGCRIWVGVSDGGPAPTGPDAIPDDEHGRGLTLVEAVSQACASSPAAAPAGPAWPQPDPPASNHPASNHPATDPTADDPAPWTRWRRHDPARTRRCEGRRGRRGRQTFPSTRWGR